MHLTSVDSLLKAISLRDRRAISKAITLIESSHPKDRNLTTTLLEGLPKPENQTYRIALSGPPGAGKSTLIEALGLYLIQQGHRVAVLAIDPTSPSSGGALLGDKTRMEHLSRSPEAFIRPSSSTKNFLGGIAPYTPDIISLLEAAHFNVILLETIGIGQNEVDAFDVVDMFILVLSPAAGDELQGLKKGILELVHMIAVNKWDGDLKEIAELTHQNYQAALLNRSSADNGWIPPVIKCSAQESLGMEGLWTHITAYYRQKDIEALRLTQQKIYFKRLVHHQLMEIINDHPEFHQKLQEVSQLMSQKGLLPRVACQQFMEQTGEKLYSFLKNNV